MGDAEANLIMPRHCLGCGYDLRGLPEPCDCPECGQHLDPGVYTWFGIQICEPVHSLRAQRIKLLNDYGLTVLAVVCLAALLNWGSVNFLRNLLGLAGLLICLFALLGVLQWVSRNHRPKSRRMIASESGLLLEPWRFEIDWNDIESVEAQPDGLPCLLYFREVPVQLNLEAQIRVEDDKWLIGLSGFADDSSSRAFAEAATRYIQVAQLKN